MIAIVFKRYQNSVSLYVLSMNHQRGAAAGLARLVAGWEAANEMRSVMNRLDSDTGRSDECESRLKPALW
jgi:hypothetical protein